MGAAGRSRGDSTEGGGRGRGARGWPAVALLGALLALGPACLGPVVSLYPPRPGEPTVSVWVVDHGWHVGLVVDRARLPDGLVPEQLDFPRARYLEFGWGDDAFYRAPEGTVGLAVKAALASPRSVLRVAGLDAPFPHRDAADAIVEIPLSRAGFAALGRFVDDTFARTGGGPSIPLGPGPYRGSRFYPARGRYHLFNTCNTWVAQALRAAGCPVTPAYAVTAGNVMWQARRAAQVAPGR
jgi:uncharacterized protein (TIGR02117 family)